MMDRDVTFYKKQASIRGRQLKITISKMEKLQRLADSFKAATIALGRELARLHEHQ